jgi:hypothetical protein
MPFTVAYTDAGIKRRDFDVYVRLLQKRGIDWSNTGRVPESKTSNRWLYVWTDRAEAEAFCAELQSETRDKNWHVRQLPAGTQPSVGSLFRVLIFMRRQDSSADFSLHPHTRTLIHRRFPKARPVSSITIDWMTKSDFEQQQGPIWDQIATMLTGLNVEQLDSLDGYQVYDLKSEQTRFDSQVAHAA